MKKKFELFRHGFSDSVFAPSGRPTFQPTRSKKVIVRDLNSDWKTVGLDARRAVAACGVRDGKEP